MQLSFTTEIKVTREDVMEKKSEVLMSRMTLPGGDLSDVRGM